MRVGVKLTRMELLNTKKRIKLAKRGHKLLKDKRDELIKNFLTLMKKNKRKREEVENELADAYKIFSISRALMSIEEVENAFLNPHESTIEYSTKNIVGINVPQLKLNLNGVDIGYSLAFTPMEIDKSLSMFHKLLEKMILLAEIERSTQLLALEIEKTRRRVNALEHILIPALEESAKYIEIKLSEMERANFYNLMRIKEIVRG